MARAFFRNTTTVRLFGKQPGERFQLAIGDDGAPTEVHWRKRLAEGAIEPVVKAASPASSSPASDPEASPAKKSTSKKGA